MIFAFYGEKRVGKDTAAKMFQEELELILEKKYQIKSFAKLPKEIISFTLGMSLETFENYKNESLIGRQMLINFAEKIKDIFGKDFWVKQVLEDNIIISDLRFIEEYNVIKKYNNNIIHIKDDNIEEENIHKLPFDYEIDNTKKNIDNLKNQIQKIILDINDKNLL